MPCAVCTDTQQLKVLYTHTGRPTLGDGYLRAISIYLFSLLKHTHYIFSKTRMVATLDTV